MIDPPAPPEEAPAPSPAHARDSLPRQVVEHLRASRTAQLAVAICVLVNLLALGGWLWSRGGQATDITLGIEGQNAAVAVDGRIQIFRPFPDGPTSGGIMLLLADTSDVPGMPSPRGIEHLRITSPEGDLLFEDDFDTLDPSWTVIEGTPTISDGMLGAEGDLVLYRDEDRADVRIETRVRNVRDLAISARVGDNGRGIVARVRPTWWNQDDSKTLSLRQGEIDFAAAGRDLELAQSETTKALVASLLRPYPYLLLLSLVALAAVTALQFARVDLRRLGAQVSDIPAWFWPALVGVVAFIVTLHFNINYREHLPYVPDSIAYLFQGKILASGNFAAAPPPVPEAFQFFDPSPIVITDDHWAAQYPFGHPMLLAFGQLFGAPWLIPPLLAGASVFMLGVAASRLYNMRVGIVAAVLLASSPFFIMQASNLMSHNTAIFYLIASLLLLTMAKVRHAPPSEDASETSTLRPPTSDLQPLGYGALAGIMYGLFMNTRPLTAAALAVPFALYLLWRLVPRKDRRMWALHVAAFCAGGLLMLGGYLLYNYGTTGDAFSTGYQATGVTFFEGSVPTANPGDGTGGAIGDAIGIGGNHRITLGLQNERVQMALLTMVLHGWPTWIGLAFVLLPFLLGTRKLVDWWLLLCALSIMGVWVLYEGDGVMGGPRYWFEALPFLLILAARGADRAASLLARAASALRARNLEAPPQLWAGRAVSFSIVGLLVAYSMWSWLLGANPTWRADFVPSTAGEMAGYLGIDDRIPRLAEEQDLHDALVLVQECGNFNCYGSVFWRNSPALDGDIVYAADIPERREEIIAAFPNRTVYVADYTLGTLRPLAATDTTAP